MKENTWPSALVLAVASMRASVDVWAGPLELAAHGDDVEGYGEFQGLEDVFEIKLQGQKEVMGIELQA